MPSSIPPLQPATYVLLPLRLISTLRDTPRALGLYSLIARLYLITHTPIPLSTPDVVRYDPTLSRGAVLRAFERLVRDGWLIETRRAGRKTCYVPTWGRIRGTPRPWRIDASLLDRPRHVAALRLDRRLLDLCMGKLTPDPHTSALISRYVTAPLLSLDDIGRYALTLAGLPVAETAALTRLQLVRAGITQPLPADAQLLALASQGTFEADGTALTLQGARLFGHIPLATAPHSASPSAQPLFFVPPDLIGALIGPMIDAAPHDEADLTPSSGGKPVTEPPRAPITWTLMDQKDQGTPPPTPPRRPAGGGGRTTSADSVPRRAGQPPETEVAQLLQALNVRPRQVAELDDVPLELVRAAIADGQARPYVRDLAGWVVAMVRDARDQGWRITSPAVLPTDAHAAALRASFARLRAEGLGDARNEDWHPDADEPLQAVLLPAEAQENTALAGAVADAASAPMADALTDAEEEPRETLTELLQRELRARTYPELHPLIARLSVWQDGDTLTLGCARTLDLPIVQARLLPLFGPVLRQLGWSQLPRLTVRTAPTARRAAPVQSGVSQAEHPVPPSCEGEL